MPDEGESRRCDGIGKRSVFASNSLRVRHPRCPANQGTATSQFMTFGPADPTGRHGRMTADDKTGSEQ